MKSEDKLTLIAKAIQIDTADINPQTELKSIEEWDSLAKISTIAMLDKEFNKILNADQIKQLKTIQDILDYMQ